MNLHKIYDNKDDYLKLSELNPKNLYFLLAQKAIKYINSTNNKNKINTSWNLLGNQIDFFYGNDQVNLVVNNKRFTGTGANLKALEGALYDLFQGELKGEVALNRPNNRSVLSDRNDFKKASGTCFSKLYKSVAWDKEGKRNSEVLGSRSNAIVLTERQFENASSVKSFNQNNFKKVNTDGVVFYLNKGAKLIDFNNTEFKSEADGPTKDLSVSEFEYVLQDIDKNLGMWARTPELFQLSQNIDSYINTVLLYKGHVYIVFVNQSGYSIKPVI